MNIIQIKNKLSKYKIAIAGAGGLGSNCAMSLVRAGVNNLVIGDFDIVNESNLNRQFYFRDQIGMKKVEALAENLYRIQPDLQLQLVDKKLNSKDIINFFADCDVIVEAFDDKTEKQMLIETVIENFLNKSLIIGTGMAGWGDNNSIKTEKLDNIYVCGDQISEISDDMPPIGPRVGIVANMQANQVLEILLSKE